MCTYSAQVERAKQHLEEVLEELQSKVEQLHQERDTYQKKIQQLDLTVSSQLTELETLRHTAETEARQHQEALESE